MDGFFIRRNFDALDLLQFLDAALHLLGFGRLSAGTVDEASSGSIRSRWFLYAASSCRRRSVFCCSYFEYPPV